MISCLVVSSFGQGKIVDTSVELRGILKYYHKNIFWFAYFVTINSYNNIESLPPYCI